MVDSKKSISVASIVLNAKRFQASVQKGQNLELTPPNGRTRLQAPRPHQLTSRLLNSQHMQTLRRLAHHPPTPTKVPMSPACFPHLAVVATRTLPSSSCGREDIQIPLPNAMSFGKIEQRATKGHEVNEVGVEDHRTNPVEKLVTL